mmetsp:Transcript_4828/g.11123  ORF Transcript_4828/g.11123 Transcript_4828/m.11123 type:complete len:212 (-) Transcript_4828:158-793(-)
MTVPRSRQQGGLERPAHGVAAQLPPRALRRGGGRDRPVEGGPEGLLCKGAPRQRYRTLRQRPPRHLFRHPAPPAAEHPSPPEIGQGALRRVARALALPPRAHRHQHVASPFEVYHPVRVPPSARQVGEGEAGVLPCSVAAREDDADNVRVGYVSVLQHPAYVVTECNISKEQATILPRPLTPVPDGLKAHREHGLVLAHSVRVLRVRGNVG